MRTISTDQSEVLLGKSRAEHCRVSVKDSGGTWRDLTTYPGFNALASVSIREDPDSPGPTADIAIRRELDKLSLAPLMTASALNRGFDPGASYNPLIAIGREIKVEVALTPGERTPGGGDWMVLFHGRVDTPDPGPSTMTIAARDLSGKLADTWFKKERVYAHGTVAGVGVSMRIWEPGGTYAVGEYVLPSEAKRNARPYFYKCTSITTGVSGSTEPAWPTSSTVSDGGVTWTYQAATITSGVAVEQVIQNMLDDCLGAGAVTLYTPTSPSFMMKPWHQTREPLLQAIRKVSLCFGGDCRYLWRSGTAQFEFTLITINRSPGSTVRTFYPSQWKELPRLAADIQGMRNWVDLIYSDTADLDAAGYPKRKLVTKKNTTSISNVYELWMEIAEDEASPINTQSEAETMAQAAVDDLSTPDVDLSMVLVHGFPFVELRDYYSIYQDGVHFDNAQSLAVHSYEHEYRDGYLRTTIHCRGKPSAGRARWHSASTHPALPPSFTGKAHRQQLFNTLSGPSLGITPVVGGARLDITAASAHKQAFMEEYEYHLSTSAGFTPSSSTLIGISASRTMEVTKLNPGQTYYGAIVPVIRNAGKVVRGLPSAEVSFTAGQAKARHLQTEVEWGRIPLNGGFETSADGTAADHWNAVTGGWGDTFVWESSASAVTGTRRLKLVNANNQNYELESSFIEVEPERDYKVSLQAQYAAGGSDGWNLYVEYYDNAKGYISASSALALDTSEGIWVPLNLRFTTGSTVKYIKLSIRSDYGTSPRTVYVDDVRLERVPDYWYQSEDSASSRSISSATWSTIISQSNDLRGGLPVIIIATGSLYAGAVDKAEFRINFGGTAQAARAVFFNEASEHQQFAFVWVVSPANNPGGSVNVELQWRSPNTYTMSQDGNDSISFVAFELGYGRG